MKKQSIDDEWSNFISSNYDNSESDDNEEEDREINIVHTDADSSVAPEQVMLILLA
jgi:hypothetical protein